MVSRNGHDCTDSQMTCLYREMALCYQGGHSFWLSIDVYICGSKLALYFAVCLGLASLHFALDANQA